MEIRKFNRMTRALAVVALLLLSQVARAAFPVGVNGIDPSRVGILIYDLNGDSVVMAHNASKWLVPASVMKSVTSAAVLSTSDAASRLSTCVMASGPVKNGVLEGDLIVECIGDPTVESRHFPANLGFCDSIVAALRKVGIRKIIGSVKVVEDKFPDPGIPQGWLNEDVIWPYGTGLYGANYKDNTIRLTLPDGKMEPAVPTASIEKTGGKGGIKVSRSRGSKTFMVSGKTKRSHSDTYSNPDPAASMVHELNVAIAHAGITVEGKKVAKSDDSSILYIHTSPAIGQVLHSLMVRSDNMMAEGMLRTLAPEATRAQAIAREKSLWSAAGLPNDGLVIEDGSGLSRNNRLSPRFLTELYRYMLTTPVANDYVALFPRAGREGTMRNFLKATPLEGRVAMKTGSMRGVQCFGGYLLGENGKPSHTIVVLVNGFTTDRARVKSCIADMLLETFVPTVTPTESPADTRSEH